MSEEQTNPAAERIKERKRNAVQPEEFLKDADAIRPTGDEQKLSFTDSFADRLAEHLEEVQADGISLTDLAQLFGVPESEVTEREFEYTAWQIRNVVYNWPSEGALLFDIATDHALRTISDEWDEVPPRQRFMIAQSLRSFQDECLFCGGIPDFNNKPVTSCCSERRVLTFRCPECERLFLEFSTESRENSHIGSNV